MDDVTDCLLYCSTVVNNNYDTNIQRIVSRHDYYIFGYINTFYHTGRALIIN